MTTDVSSEVVKCPNCKEDVPKTLYCLNCGYPLYKQEKLADEEPPKVEAEAIKVEEKIPEPPVEEVKEPEPEVEEIAPEPKVIEVKEVESEEPDDVVMQVEEEKPAEPAIPEPPVTEKVEEVKMEEVKVDEPAISVESEPVKVKEQAVNEPVIQVEETKIVEIEPAKTEEAAKVETPVEPEIKSEAPKTEGPTASEPDAVKVEEPVVESPPVQEVKVEAPVAEPLTPEPESVKVDETPVVQEPAKVEETKVIESTPSEVVKVEEPAKVEEAPQVEVVEVVEKPAELVATVEPVAAVSAEVSKETVISVDDTSLSAGSAGLSAEASKMLDSYEEDTVLPYYVPDSLTKDLMESIAKNLTLKIRLVNLLREGKLKEQTFDRLFKGYVEEGQIWISRRDELIKKLNEEIDEMEETYANSIHQLEILEVRHSIGEATEDEYSVKAPAYQWDVDHLDFEIGKKKNRVGFLEVISSVLPIDQIKELKELASVQYNTIESLEVADEETIANIKASLYDAIKILG